MEDVLDVYTRHYDDRFPLVCMDETSKQQIMEVRPPRAMEPGRSRRYDAEYKRNGVSNLFMFFAPLQGWRHVKVTDHRTKIDWAFAMRELVDEHFSCAKRITLVMDNLNTHCPSSLYEAFEPEEAKRILSRRKASLCSEARQLAQHGRDRTEHPRTPVPVSQNSGSGNIAPRGLTVAKNAQLQSFKDRLAIHNQRRKDQTEKTVSIISTLTEY